jgi:signal transduction histidine kinase
LTSGPPASRSAQAEGSVGSKRGGGWDWRADRRSARAPLDSLRAGDPSDVRTLLARADRLAALGTLAASIAHEIRNPMVSVRTFVELLPERWQDDEFRTEFRQLALGEIERICELLNDLLAFARPAPADSDPSDPRVLVQQTVRLLEPEARKRDVALTLHCADPVPLAPIGEGRLKQVLMNIVLNALEACDVRGTVAVHAVPTDGGGGSRIEVSDTGRGIAPHLLPHIFDPFVTDKETGSGLGLYIANRIVTEHGGTLDGRARPDGGTVFTILLPAAGAVCDAGAD